MARRDATRVPAAAAAGTVDARHAVMMIIRTLALPTTAFLVCTGCAPPQSTTQTTSAGSPHARTVDNAGFVDPVGRTSTVTASGSISERNTGVGTTHTVGASTSGSGGTSEPAIGPPAPAVPSSSADPIELTERAARALCDREGYCEHIGTGKAFESADACMGVKRERVRQAIAERGCRDNIRGEAVSRCLTAIRAAECGNAGEALPPPAACDAEALCK